MVEVVVVMILGRRKGGACMEEVVQCLQTAPRCGRVDVGGRV